MTTSAIDEKLKQLREPLSAKDIEWKVGYTSKDMSRGQAIPYITFKAVADRLDEVMGAANWKNEFRTGPAGGVVCSLSLRLGDEWVAKENGADNTEVEAVKGGMSDALKRAATIWGIGRYLYAYVPEWISLENGRLTYHPILPDEFLPAAERGQSGTVGASRSEKKTDSKTAEAGETKKEAGAPVSEATAASEAETAQASAETEKGSPSVDEPEASKANATGATDGPKNGEPAATTLSEQPTQAAVEAVADNPETNPAWRPAGLTDDELKRVDGLIERLEIKNIAPDIIKDYVNGKGKDSMGDVARDFVLRRVERHVAAKKAA